MSSLFSRIVFGPVLLCSFAGWVNAELIAAQLGSQNLQQRVGGIDAIGGRGDWLLSNGTLCATISDSDHETGLSADGGWLIDLGHCGRDDDQLGYTHLLPMMDPSAMLPVTAIKAEVADGKARLTVERAGPALQAVIRYTMELDRPRELRIDSELRRIAAGPDINMVGQLWLHPGRSLTPFTVSTRDRDYSPGYRYKAFEKEGDAASLNTMVPADLTVLIGSEAVGPPISYGIHSLDGELIEVGGEGRPLLQFSLVEADYTNQVWLTRPLWFGDGEGVPGRLQMMQSLFMDIDPGETLKLAQRVLVSTRGDAASITDHVYTGHWLEGTLDTAAAQLKLYDARGNPLTAVRPAADGSFRLRLPSGVDNAELEVITAHGEPRRMALAFDAGDLQLGSIDTLPPGTVLLPGDTTLRLVFTGVDGTADPAFGSDLSQFSLGRRAPPLSSQTNSIDLVQGQRNPSRVSLAAGKYRVYASRGPHYTASSQDIELASGQQLPLDLPALRRVVDTGDWVSTDFHVHSGYSFDSAISAEQRLRSFVAQDAAVLVATEHDRIAPMAERARALGLQREITVVGGAELTGMVRSPRAPAGIGHLNVFPLAYRPGEFAGGMPAHEGLRLHQVMAGLRRLNPDVVVQLNHPRRGVATDAADAFFEHLSLGERFNPGLPLDNIQNRSLIEAGEDGVRDIDFDLLEMANGGDLAQYQQVRADWLSLILQGEYRPAVASSDSHHLHQPAALPRSYVAYRGAAGGPVELDRWRAAARAGRIVGSSGPLPELRLTTATGVGGGVGDTLVGREFKLSLTVQSAPWVNVDQAWIYLNGRVIWGGTIRPGESLELPVRADEDSFLFAEVYGDAGETYQALAPGQRPMAFTNPIWIDADGDGQWSAPGLASLPLAISRPSSFPNQRPR